MDNLKIGGSTNMKIIKEFFDISLTSWQAVGINDVSNNIVLLWVNLENDLHNTTYNDGFLSRSKIFQWESQKIRTKTQQLLKEFLKKKLMCTCFVGLGIQVIIHIWGN